MLDGYLHSEAAVFSYFQESDTLFSIRKDIELFGTCTFVIERSRSVNVDVRSSKRILFLSCIDNVMGHMLHFFMTILYGGSAKTLNFWHLLILQNFHDLYYFLHCTPFLIFNGGQDQSFESTDSQRTSLTGLHRMVRCPGGVGHALGGPYQIPVTLCSVLCRHRVFPQSSCRAAALDPGS